MIYRTILCTLTLLLPFACSSKKKEAPAKAPEQVATTAAPQGQAQPTGMPEGPYKMERTQRATLMRKSTSGETFEWKLLDGIEVKDESIKQVYQSRGSFFVSFKATIQTGEQNCLIRWKTELIEGPTGRGDSVNAIEGVLPARAGELLTLSGVVALSDKDAAKVGSASAGYWTLCGDALPTPSALDFEITETRSEQVKLGNAFDLHYTVMQVQSKVKETDTAERCHFDLVAEDVDAEGYTLNRDFAIYSLNSNDRGLAKIRRSTFEGGAELDYAEAAKSKRSYLRKVSCTGPWPAKDAKLEGIQFKDLKLARFQPEVETERDKSWATFDHSASIKNTIGKDCSFRIRYRLLDKHGIPMHKTPVLSEILHLKKGSSVDYQATKHRLYAWQDQADDVSQLVVNDATPVSACTKFDPKQAL